MSSRSGVRSSVPCVKGGGPPDRGRPTTAGLWACAEVPQTTGAGRSIPTTPIYTDHWGAYSCLLPAGQHHPCDKGTGLTSIVESLNTKWRQRQSGLVRRACGVHPRIEDDLFERFRLLVDEHNRQSARQWQRR